MIEGMHHRGRYLEEQGESQERNGVGKRVQKEL